MASLISDRDIERLEKVRDILKEIKELNIGFGLDNIIETNDKTTLVFTTESFYQDGQIIKEITTQYK